MVCYPATDTKGFHCGTLPLVPNAHPLINKAVAFASEAHDGQIHRDGKPAVNHAFSVAARFGQEPRLYAIAMLHDVLEDCPQVSATMICNEFGLEITDAVRALTRGETESWNKYIFRVCQNPDAVRVKIADIEHNISRADAKCMEKMDMYTKTLSYLLQIQSHD